MDASEVVVNTRWRYKSLSYTLEALLLERELSGKLKFRVERIISGDPGIGVGECWYPFISSVLMANSPYSLILENKMESGTYCGGCKDYYPYADNVPGFKCWACRSGW